MWADDPDTRAALAALGLDRGASLAQAKAAFRKRAFALHPDTGTANRTALSELAKIIRAVRHLERAAPECLDLTLSPEEAASGITRTARIGGRNAVFRIPPNVTSGTTIAAVGDENLQARIIIHADTEEAAPSASSGGLTAFIDEFASAAPAARFAAWLRKARSAA
ncbi:J domain-containing protein [Hyphobacterium sp.]|uniref:J domain-containing protein n=1 Tax=Hyphobacterium sp. TaxID=2004662 RepID=UPI003BA9DEB0